MASMLVTIDRFGRVFCFLKGSRLGSGLDYGLKVGCVPLSLAVFVGCMSMASKVASNVAESISDIVQCRT